MNHFPIVLSHGIARFDYLTDSILRRTYLRLWEWRRDLDRIHYFKGISDHSLWIGGWNMGGTKRLRQYVKSSTWRAFSP